MKKQPAHGCMPADRIICRTWEHTNRALIFQSVPGCPKCPTVPTFRTWDNGTGRDSYKVGRKWEGQAMNSLPQQKSMRYYHNNIHINKIAVIIHRIYSTKSTFLLTTQSGKKRVSIQVSQVSHTVPPHTGTGQWDSGTNSRKPIIKKSHEQLFITEI